MRHPIIRFAIVFSASVAFGASSVSAWQPACAEASPLTADTVTYIGGLDAGTTALFAVEIPEPGRLAVEIAVSGTEENIPWIDVLPVSCDSGKSSPGRFLERNLARQILEITTPGIYAARVGAVDPLRGLGRYALSVQAFPASPLAFKTGESESDDDTDDSNNEIVPFVFDGPIDTKPVCDDSFTLCARELEFGVVVEGEISGGGTGDYFSFTLERARTVRVESAGTTDTLGTLYDAAGHRLLVADDGGAGENFLFRVPLPAGRYVLQLEGATGCAGDYRLEVSESDL